MLVNNNFLTWFLISWRLWCQSIVCQVWKSLLINMDINMEIFQDFSKLQAYYVLIRNFLYIMGRIYNFSVPYM